MTPLICCMLHPIMSILEYILKKGKLYLNVRHHKGSESLVLSLWKSSLVVTCVLLMCKWGSQQSRKLGSFAEEGSMTIEDIRNVHDGWRNFQIKMIHVIKDKLVSCHLFVSPGCFSLSRWQMGKGARKGPRSLCILNPCLCLLICEKQGQQTAAVLMQSILSCVISMLTSSNMWMSPRNAS